MDHRRRRIERGLRVEHRRQLLVVDRNEGAGVFRLGARLRHHRGDRLALPARHIDRDRVLRRRLDALEMGQHADPRRDDFRQRRAGDHRDHARRPHRRRRVDRLDARVGVGRAHERHMHHARQHDVAHILPAPLGEPCQIRPRHRAPDVRIRPVERRQRGRHIGGDLHRVVPGARASRPLFDQGRAGRPRSDTRRGHRFDGIDDRLVAGTAAVVAREMFADRGAGRSTAGRHLVRSEQFLRGEQHAGRTEAALQRVAPRECLLQVGNLACVRHTFDGLDARAVALHGEREAAAHRDAVEPHRAGAAHALLASDMAAGEAELLAQEIDERRAHLHGFAHLFAIHRERNRAGRSGHGRKSTWPRPGALCSFERAWIAQRANCAASSCIASSWACGNLLSRHPEAAAPLRGPRRMIGRGGAASVFVAIPRPSPFEARYARASG